MAKGSPDSQHELVVTGLDRCLRLAYPAAQLSFGTVAPKLHLKPDIFVNHSDGRQWAYEAVNKNVNGKEIEAKHRRYAQAGVRDYWILWEARRPGKSLDDSILAQSVWITDEIVEGPFRCKLNELQRTLARLGGGHVYVFSIHKPFLDLMEHWALKLAMTGLEIYSFPSDQLDTGQVEGEWDFVPLPYLIFDEQGRPQSRPGMDRIPPFLQPFAESLSRGPVFAQRVFAELDALMKDPRSLLASIPQALTQLGERHADVQLQKTEELTQALEHLQELGVKMSSKQGAGEIDALQVLDALDNLIAALPLQFQGILREVIPVTGDMVRQMLELKQWFDEDEHLQKLLADM